MKRILVTMTWVADDAATEGEIDQHLNEIYAMAEEADHYSVHEFTWRAVIGEER